MSRNTRDQVALMMAWVVVALAAVVIVDLMAVIIFGDDDVRVSAHAAIAAIGVTLAGGLAWWLRNYDDKDE